MNVPDSGASCRRASAVGITALAVAFLGAGGLKHARAHGGGGRGNPLPAQKAGNPLLPGPANSVVRYAPYPVKDPTAAERAVLAGWVYRTILDEGVQRARTGPRPAGGPPDVEALFRIELAERLGPWSLRWQEAQDNAAKSLAGRYRALSDHVGRMRALEDGRFGRETVPPARLPAGRPAQPKPPRGFADVARFFRPVDERSLDSIVPELVDFERPLNPRGIAVTPAEQVEIAGRTYRAILDEAIDRFLAPPRAGAARRDVGAIFDALLAERLGHWSDLWRQAEDAAAEDPSWRLPAVRYRSVRLAMAGTRQAIPDARLASIRSHLQRMSELEDGRFGLDARNRAGRSVDQPVDRTRLREFADVVRFFRMEAESQLRAASRSTDTDGIASSRDAALAAGRIYQAIWDGAVRRYREPLRAGGAPPDARLVLDTRLAERLGAWSIRWGRAQAAAGQGSVARFDAVRSHLERMRSLEDGRALHDARARAGPLRVGPDATVTPHQFADVARFFRLEALWELARIRSR